MFHCQHHQQIQTALIKTGSQTKVQFNHWGPECEHLKALLHPVCNGDGIPLILIHSYLADAVLSIKGVTPLEVPSVSLMLVSRMGYKCVCMHVCVSNGGRPRGVLACEDNSPVEC